MATKVSVNLMLWISARFWASRFGWKNWCLVMTNVLDKAQLLSSFVEYRCLLYSFIVFWSTWRHYWNWPKGSKGHVSGSHFTSFPSSIRSKAVSDTLWVIESAVIYSKLLLDSVLRTRIATIPMFFEELSGWMESGIANCSRTSLRGETVSAIRSNCRWLSTVQWQEENKKMPWWDSGDEVLKIPSP